MYKRLLVTLFAFALVMPEHAAQAVGNVLLPEDNTNTPAANNPPSIFLPAPTNNAPQADTIKPTAPAPTVKPKPKTEALPSNGGNYTPIPPTVIDVTQQGFTMPQPIIHKTAKGGMTVAYPTTILQMPAMPEMPIDPNAPKPTRQVAIDMPDKTWSAGDIDQVNKKLGLDRDKIPTICYITANGVLTTDGAQLMFDTGGTMHTDVGYNGTVKSVMATLQALCSVVPLGPEQGIIKQVGDKYTVDLGVISCQAPPPSTKPVTVVSLVRNPNSPVGSCRFQ